MSKHLVIATNLETDADFEKWAAGNEASSGVNIRIDAEEIRPSAIGITRSTEYENRFNALKTDAANQPIGLLNLRRFSNTNEFAKRQIEIIFSPPVYENPINNFGYGGVDLKRPYIHGFSLTENPPIKIVGATICAIDAKGKGELEFQDCVIGSIHLSANSKIKISLTRCRVGSLVAGDSAIGDLHLRESRVHDFSLSFASSKESSIQGAVTINDCSFPTKKSDVYKSRAIHFTALRHNLEDLQNSQAAHFIRGIEGGAQFEHERGLFRWIIWLHGFASAHGLQPLRPLAWVASLYALMALVTLALDGAQPNASIPKFFERCVEFQRGRESTSAAKYYIGWRAELCDSANGRAARAVVLPGQKLLNPLGLIPREALLVPKTWFMSSLLVMQDLFNVLMYFHFFFAIRRRFRM